MSEAVRSFRIAVAFLERDAAQQLSYRFNVALDAGSIVVTTTMFFFLARVIDAGDFPAFRRHGGGYFAFAITGIALSKYLSLSLHAFSDQIRQGQITGTLEALFLTPATTRDIVAWGSLWSFVYQSLKIVIYLGVAALFGLSLRNANWGGAALVVSASIFALAPLGILAAAFILVWKQGDPISQVMTSLSTLFAGVYYPLDVLPDWLRAFAYALPLTHAVGGFRSAIVEGATLAALARPIATLVAFGLVLTPLAFFAFSRAVARVKRTGGLAHF